MVPLVSEALLVFFLDEYGDTIDNVVPVVAGNSVSGLIENDDKLNSGDIPLSKNADVRTSHSNDFTAIQMRGPELSLAVPDRAYDVFRLALQGFDALLQS